MERQHSGPQSQFMLSAEAFAAISEVLKELESATRAELTVFCDANGIPIVHCGKTRHVDYAALSTLNAANYSATRETARLIGEKKGFKFLFLEGESHNIYLCNVGYDFLLTIIFSKSVALGMVRIYANKATIELAKILQNAQEKEQMSERVIDEEFSKLLSDALENSFKTAR